MKLEELLSSLHAAIDRLAEVLALEKSDVVRDSAIKRFEIVFDLSWKTSKAFLEIRGLSCVSPKTCFQEAFRQGLIEYENIWLQMLEMRNASVHTYNQVTAEEIYQNLPATLAAFRHLAEALGKND